MNLARPEYYLAEVLSKLKLDPEQRILHLYEAGAARGYPLRLVLPPNLVIIGGSTTTHALSPKVLDRAVYLNVDSIDLRGWFERQAQPATALAEPVLLELQGPTMRRMMSPAISSIQSAFSRHSTDELGLPRNFLSRSV